MARSDLRLDGKTAVITGGGTGIGKAIATAFAAAGAYVVVGGRTKKAIDEVAQSIGGEAMACDVTKLDDVERLFAQALKRNGRVDVFVNNAGQTGPVGDVATVNLDEWRECMEVNVMGALHGLRVAARIMTAQKGGSIINMSSRMGLIGYPNRTAYTATKFALFGMTEAVAREVGAFGVRVNALCPGAVNGDLMDRVIARRVATEGRTREAIIEESYTKTAALKRWVEPEEVANAALFLASDASSAITGDRIKVDAGRF